MKRWTTLLVVSIIFFILSLVPTHLFLPGWASSESSCVLPPDNVCGPSTSLYLGSTIVLDVRITGANKDIYFYITNAEGRGILNPGRIYDGYHLEWQQTSFGSVRLNFDNSMSYFSTKTVTWDLITYHYGTTFGLLAALVFVIGLIYMEKESRILSQLRRKAKPQPESTTVKCLYCNTTYDRKLANCPHCGARNPQQ